ncbi:MAG: hypothetical protein JNJ73_05760 [Hyphomonadaceae bacterium]|nr:hypothetical protein [Hyphomonadaceae bacterium]
MIQAYAQQLALVLAGMALGWTTLFCFVVAPVSFKDMDYGRADRHVRRIIKAGHGALAVLCLAAAGFALVSGAVAGAVIAAMCAAFYVMCQWALAPRDDPRPAGARRQMKGQRVVASLLTAGGLPLMVAMAVLTRLGI